MKLNKCLIGSFRSYISAKCCQLLFFIQFASFTLLTKAAKFSLHLFERSSLINAFKSKKLRVRWKSSQLKDNFVVNMVGAGR